MRRVRMLCWNVNGIRALRNKGFLDWLAGESPDIMCLQETKVQQEQLPDDLRQVDGYHTYWEFPDRKGYSGVATLSKNKPLSVQNGLGIERFDVEGRAIISEYPGFTLLNVYFPNGKMGPERLQYKLDFYEAFLDIIQGMRKQGRRLVICGDVNTAHKPIDIARPKENEKVSGFLPIERAWIDKLVDLGYVDTFRHFNKEPGQYTWWDLKTGARQRNVGWRIDYFIISEDLVPSLESAFILHDVPGSDHCPIGIVLALE